MEKVQIRNSPWAPPSEGRPFRWRCMNSSARDLEDAEKCPAEALVTLPQAKTAKTGLLEHGSQLMKVSCFQMNRSPSMGPEPLLLRKTSDAVALCCPHLKAHADDLPAIATSNRPSGMPKAGSSSCANGTKP